MSIRYLDLSGAVNFWTNIKNYIIAHIPTKTSELTNDSGYLTSHQSLDNYVTLNSNQTITAIKTITGGNQGKMLFKNPNYTKGDAVESGTTISRLYFGNGASYATANGVLTTDISSAGNTSIELCAMNNTASNSNRASLIITYDKSATSPRLLKSWGNFIPYSDNNYTLGNTSNIWKECYSNAYYLGTTAFGDIVTHNASEFLTSHQSLSSCVKNVVTNSQSIKSTAITRGTAPSSAQTFGIAFTDNNAKYIGNVYGQYATDKSAYVGLYAYKGTTTSNSDNASVRVGYDASGNAYTYAPTPATADNSTQIATTAFVKAQGYLTSHPTITLSSNTTSTASPAHGGTFTCIDSVTQDTNGHITKVNTKTITLPADSNTDTKVTQTVTTANSNYPVLLCATADATATGTTTSRFSEGLAVNARYSSISMTNKYDTANTKGVRDSTKGYLNGDIIFKCYDASEMGRIHCESSKNGYQQTYMQARSYIKNGAISPEGTATTCYITVRVRDNGSKTIYTDGSWENSLTPYANETYDIGTSSLRWMRCYCKNFYGSYVDIAGRYLENEFSTNARTCLYLKSNRDTDGQSGIYFSKFRQNRAQGALTGSDLVSLNLDVLENSVRTNSCIAISFRYFENDVPTKIYVTPKASATSYMGTADNPWTNAYITNLNLNGNAFDPASVSGNIGDIVFASAYYSSITGTASLDLTVSGNTLYLACFDNNTLVIDSSASSLPGTWKFLGRSKPTTTSGNADTKRVGLWKRIA